MNSQQLEDSNLELISTLNSLPGVSSCEVRPSITSRSNDIFEFQVSIQFAQDSNGTAERLLVLYAAERTKSRVDLKSSNLSNPNLLLTCNPRKTEGLIRALRYASELDMSDRPSGKVIRHGNVPIPILLNHCLAAFARDYAEESGIRDLPSLPVWSNLLRVLRKDPIPQKDVNKRAIIATRTRKVVLRECEVLGWVETLRKTSPRTSVFVKLTTEGTRASQIAEARIKSVEKRWKHTYTNVYDQLYSALGKVVRGFDLKYPYYITGYGPADDGLTGGAYLPAEEGPPPIPARGEEWPVVLRNSHGESTKMPLSALLSQALAGFAIEYEMENLGRLGHILTLYRYIGNDGVSLKAVRNAGGITGNGRSLHERHMNIVLEPGRTSDNSRTVYLTPKSRRARDSYLYLVHDLELRWRGKYGANVMNDMRRALESLSEDWPECLPDYPNTTNWMMPWFRPYTV
ncbi:MAG: MarR family winged helix-turn-helix transcriptional regulator [Gammaproteobacteria bacterium]|nr:MarR family winged helix-turn-helix transcriptional regulator [Gammaproteobacteria bacterium]